MAILILSGYTEKNANYHEWLRNINEEIVLLTSENFKDFYEKHKDFYTHIEYFTNYITNDSVVKRATLLHQQYNFDRLIAPYEYDLIRAAMLREQLHIEGQSLDSALTFRDKFFMKEHAKKNNINISCFSDVNTKEDLRHFIHTNGFPIVIKPRLGAGGEGIEVISSHHDLSQLEMSKNDKYIVEEFIEGEMYHIDALIKHGSILFQWPSKYINDNLEFKDGAYFAGSYILDKQDPVFNKLIEFNNLLIQSMPIPQVTTLHTEVFLRNDGELILCEVASRTAGGKINDQLEAAFGINLLKYWIQLQVNPDTPQGYFSNEPLNYTGSLLIAPLGYKLVSYPKSKPSFIECLDYHAKEGEFFNQVGSLNDRIASFIVKGKNKKEIIELLNCGYTWFKQNSVWDF
ncbi:ATP-grasp domain-containing protein [Bacillus alkalicellulosilyticus]|uniref:ATP-grasp domain-containing protein n=1 Tax=Alkalihalobacterium alkalicellulosilyticum TaxID=1912214 RepID=UPI000998B8B7|nr:ATP-grasp domain-containing protein [Bacillus alkalicellulosilyticus]